MQEHLEKKFQFEDWMRYTNTAELHEGLMLDMISTSIHRLWPLYVEHICVLKKHSPKRDSNYTDGINKYFITLTKGIDDPKIYLQQIEKLLNYKAFKVEAGYGVVELTKDGSPHAHIYVECKRYLRKDKIERVIWTHSFIDIKNVKKDNGISAYVDKDKDNKDLLEYLADHKCARTYRKGTFQKE